MIVVEDFGKYCGVRQRAAAASGGAVLLGTATTVALRRRGAAGDGGAPATCAWGMARWDCGAAVVEGMAVQLGSFDGLLGVVRSVSSISLAFSSYDTGFYCCYAHPTVFVAAPVCTGIGGIGESLTCLRVDDGDASGAVSFHGSIIILPFSLCAVGFPGCKP